MGFIYEIRHMSSGRVYIGSTGVRYASSRWQTHRHCLRHEKHQNLALQRAWSAGKEEDFVFRVLETVADTEPLLEREQVWFDHYRSLDAGVFNVGTDVRSTLGHKMSDETKTKQRAKKLGVPAKGVRLEKMQANQRSRRKPIQRLDLDSGAVIETYESVSAAHAAGYNMGNVVAVCKGRWPTAYGYGWRYENPNHIHWTAEKQLQHIKDS